MTIAETMDRLRATRVIPVIRTRAASHAATAVRWLHEVGLRVFEITLTVPDAPSLIHDLAADPDLLIGAGTVPDRATAEACLAAGAAFVGIGGALVDEARIAAGDHAAIQDAARKVIG